MQSIPSPDARRKTLSIFMEEPTRCVENVVETILILRSLEDKYYAKV